LSLNLFSQSAEEIIKKAEDMIKGESSSGTFTMTVVNPDFKRTVVMESWWVGNEKALIIIKSPAKESGNKTLKIKNEMWNYLKNTETTIKIPPSMMLQSWNGSDLTNLENVEFPLMLLGMSAKDRKERAISIMEELDIAELANKRPNSVSGGQQQRVAVARAIVHSPILVLADEPTANLDSKSASSLLDLMEKMNKEKNITFIFSSHDKNVIDRAKRLILLKDGMILQDENK
jgi:ABC-type lipoprotein export system ATPase subunit